MICVNNGLEAVDILAEDDSFDLVLMDLQMPILDGYRATELIRGFSEPMCGIPIVAMTADAMDGAKEKAISKGFTDYVTKPIAPVELFEVLVKHISTAGVRLETELDHTDRLDLVLESKQGLDSTPENTFESISERYNMKAVDTEDGLMRVTGNEDLYHRILLKFYENNQSLSKEVKRLIAESNYEMARRTVHTVKGVSGNIGAKSLQKAAEKLEYAIRDRVIYKIDSIVNEFAKELRMVLDDIRPYIENNAGNSSEDIDKRVIRLGDNDELREHIFKLMPSVVMGDVKSCKATVEKLSSKKWSPEFDDEIEGLLSALTKYKYEKAESIALILIDKLSS